MHVKIQMEMLSHRRTLWEHIWKIKATVLLYKRNKIESSLEMSQDTKWLGDAQLLSEAGGNELIKQTTAIKD